MNAGKRYLRAPDIADLTGVSIRTVRRWIADEILSSTKVGGARLVAAAEVEAMLCSSHGECQAPCDDAEEYDGESEE